MMKDDIQASVEDVNYMIQVISLYSYDKLPEKTQEKLKAIRHRNMQRYLTYCNDFKKE